MSRTKFLLIREIGAGLWNEMHHVLTQLLAAEIMQRIPWFTGVKAAYTPALDGFQRLEQFSEPISSYCVHDLAKEVLLYRTVE